MSAELVGTLLGQYEIVEFLDDNGVILSYRAWQKSLKRFVEVHIIKPGQHEKWHEALVRGAEIAAAFEHPNVVPVIDYGVQDGVDYVVLRLMEGGSLRRRLENGPLSFQDTVSIVRQIGGALDYLHSQGGCHGDPATVNIIFDKGGSAYIADFYLLGYLQITALETPAGVPAFMAPERRFGEPPSPLTDQYALGGVAYNMLTGRNPRESNKLMPPQEYRAEIPTAVNEVLFRALALKPEDRYPTVADFVRQFENAMQATPQPLFISYSRQDTAYVQGLKDYLQENGLPIWMDHAIQQGDQWFNVINDAIKTSAAFLIVMSPEAEQSEWVQKEILLAKRYQKPIFPLLLRGTEFPILIDLQFADVRHGDLPTTDFYRLVARAVYGN